MAFAQASMRVRSAVTVRNGTKQADGRSPSDLILLLAFPGDQLLLEVEGEDAAEVIDPLARLLGSPGEGS
jgi:phosphotransferase system HPr-like phosphotransfer protein